MTYPDEDLTLSNHLDPDERDPEAPTEDVVEQATTADYDSDELGDDDAPRMSESLEAPQWDAYEQSQVVRVEDDYR
jgi:hypothetical protein